MALPQHRVAERAEAEGGEAVQVLRPAGVAVALQLVEVLVADAIDGAFDAPPTIPAGGGVRLS